MKKIEASQTYRVLDAGDFEKLEQIGTVLLRRPCPQAVWRKSLSDKEWQGADAVFTRDKAGSGKWNFKNKKLEDANLVVDFVGFLAKVSFTSFGHLGFFVEHQKNWEFIQKRILGLRENGVSEPRILNLFAYTGLLTAVCARAGASVTHVDSSKSSVSWAETNFELNRLERKKIRCIVEDVRAYVKKELKRGTRYHGIILDPPSFGRGEKSQVWKIEEHLGELMSELSHLRDPKSFSFMILSSHSQGYTPIALENIVRKSFDKGKFKLQSGEMVIETEEKDLKIPSGAECILSVEQ